MSNRKIFLLFLFGVVTSFSAVIFAGDPGVGGIEVRDGERFYHRLKHLRAKRPQDAENTLQIANLYYSFQMQDEAIKEYRRCLRIDPENLNAKWFLSQILVEKGYFEEAFRLTREIMNKKPRDPEVYAWAGEILMKMEKVDLAEDYFARCDELLLLVDPGRKDPRRKKYPGFQRLTP